MTLPNAITLARIAMIPVFMFFLLSGGEQKELIALILFAVASLTDGLDGYIARKNNCVTDFGKFLDPTADKLLVSAALILFIEKGWIPATFVFIILGREFLVTSLRQVAVSKGVVMAAAWSGKVKTVVQILGILLILSPLREYIMVNDLSVAILAAWAMMLVTVYSGYDYIKSNWSILLSSAK